MTASVAGLPETRHTAAWAQRLLIAYAAIAALATAQVLISGSAMPGAAGAAMATVQFVGFLACAFFFLRWLYLANVKVRAMGAQDMMGSPGWAVGWFFVPFANLVMPLLTMRETWKASADPADWQIAPVPASLGFWWAAWIVSGVAGAIAFQLEVSGGKEAFEAASGFAVASDLASVPAALLLARIVAGIEAMQQRSAPRAAFA